MKFILALWLSKLAAFVIKLFFPSRGTDFPGALSYKICKDFMKHFKGIDYSKLIFITGTNGKSTTTNLMYHCLKQANKTVAANLTGSNMRNGAASVLISNSTLTGKVKAEFILIEVDERSFPYIIRDLKGENVLITNIMQDQVHRNGDPDFIYQIIRKHMPDNMTMFLNNDEPRSASYRDLAKNVYYYGVDKNSLSYNKVDKYEVSMPCPYCFSKINFDYMNSANVGQFSCSDCDFASTNDNLTLVENVDYENHTFTIRQTKNVMSYDAPIMMYNYSAVSSVLNYFGISDEVISSAFDNFENLKGRMDVIHYKGKDIKFYRIKQGNPETIQMAIDAISPDVKNKVVAFGMCIIPERRPKFVPHYTNTYYSYECNFKPVLNDSLEKMIIFSDYVAYDQKNRLLYDGANEDILQICESEEPKDVLEALVNSGCDNLYLIAPLRNIKIFYEFLKKEGEDNE